MDNIKKEKWTYAFTYNTNERFIREEDLGSGIVKVIIKNLNYDPDSFNNCWLHKSTYYLNGREISYTYAQEILKEFNNNKPYSLQTNQSPSQDQKETIIAADNHPEIKETELESLQNFNDLTQLTYRLTLGLKLIDCYIDFTSFINKPSFTKFKNLAFDAAHFYSMLYGTNKYALGLTALESIYWLYQGQQAKVLLNFSTTLSYMLLAKLSSDDTNISYSAFVYSTAMAAITGYGTLNKLYSYYQQTQIAEMPENSLNGEINKLYIPEQ